MFGYYLELALRSLKRSPGLTALMVLSIGFGVAASMTTYSVFRAVSGDPIPWKSSKLFVPQVDMRGPTGRDATGEPPTAMDYADAVTLMRAHRAELQSAMYPDKDGYLNATEYAHLMLVQQAGKSAPPMAMFDMQRNQCLDFKEYLNAVEFMLKQRKK